MAKKRRISPAATTLRGASPRAPVRGGLWHRPQLLNLIANVLLFFAVLALSWASVTWILSKPVFPLRHLVLRTAPVQVTQKQIEHAARIAVRGNFFTARLEEVREVFETLPWVRHAEVRRLWPDGIELSLEEHEAVAYWKNIGDSGGDVRLISRQGEVFAGSRNVAMPHFSGPQGSAVVVLESFGTYSKILQPLQAKLVRIELSARGAWRLWLDNGLSIVLDREQERSPVEEQLKSFVAAWPRLQDTLGGRIAHADLRYPNGFALTLVDYKTPPQ